MSKAGKAFKSLPFSEYLYDRSSQFQWVEALLNKGLVNNTRFIGVKGPSGIGKTAFITQALERYLDDNHAILYGKYDYLNNHPYQGLYHALKQLLTILKRQSVDFKRHLSQAVHPNGIYLSNILPELESIIGKQESVVSGVNEPLSYNRLEQVFSTFLEAVCSEIGPIVIVLDDVQWMDNLSISLLSVLQTSLISTLTVCILYRDEAIDQDSQLASLVGTNIPTLTLTPLSKPQVEQWLFDLFQYQAGHLESLLAFCLEKTHGNPFSIRQFLELLLSEGLLYFDESHQKWQWKSSKISQVNVSENVADVLINRISGLNKDIHSVLKTAACFGTYFNFKDLLVLSNLDETTLSLYLEVASKSGYITIIKPLKNYAFQHDKIQKTFYGDPAQKNQLNTHYTIANLAYKQWALNQDSEALFAAIQHYIIAAPIIIDKAQQFEIIKRALSAGLHAKESMAFSEGFACLNTFKHWINDTHWQTHSVICVRYFLTLIQLELYTHRTTTCLSTLEARIDNDKDQVELNNVLSAYYTSIGEHDQAIKLAITSLKLLGEDIPFSPGKMQIAYAIIWLHLKFKITGTKKIQAYHKATDERQIMVQNIIGSILPFVYLAWRLDLFIYLVAYLIKKSFKHGFSNSTSFGISTYTMLVCICLRQYKNGQKYDELVESLCSTCPDPVANYRAKLALAAFSKQYHYPFQTIAPIAKIQTALAASFGDYTYASYWQFKQLIACVFYSSTIGYANQIADESLAFLKRIKQWELYNVCLVLKHFCATILDESIADNSFITGQPKHIPELKQYSAVLGLLFNSLNALKHVLSQDYELALKQLQLFHAREEYVSGMLQEINAWFLYAYVQYFRQLNGSKWTLKERYYIRKYRNRFKSLAKHNPINFQAMSLILEALHQNSTRKHTAILYLKQAKDLASTSGIHLIAILAHRCILKIEPMINPGCDKNSLLEEDVHLYKKWKGI